MDHPFTDLHTLEQRFADGLAAMLATHPSPGVYILVFANAARDPVLDAVLTPALAARHHALVAEFTARLRRGDMPDEPDDDMMVFLKLALIGFEHRGRVAQRSDGPWQACFNPLRALRPPRTSGQRYEGLLRAFDPAGFHFNKPFLAREILWSGELGGKATRLLYNKFPFARLHGLVVPEPERCLPQMLSAEYHDWAWNLCAQSGITDLCLGYNSSGAGASVNHLHFQSFVPDAPLAIFDPRFSHNGGERAYPLPCWYLLDRAAAWRHLDGLHQRNQPYNLIYHRTGLHCVARVPQDSPQLHAANRGYGWSEMAGVVTLYRREIYDAWTGNGFVADLGAFKP